MWGIFNKATGKLDCHPDPMVFENEIEAEECLAELEYGGTYEKNEYEVRYFNEDDAKSVAKMLREGENPDGWINVDLDGNKIPVKEGN